MAEDNRSREQKSKIIIIKTMLSAGPVEENLLSLPLSGGYWHFLISGYIMKISASVVTLPPTLLLPVCNLPLANS